MFVVFAWDLLARGVLAKVSFCSILVLTPLVNSLTCFSMYAKNASEFHLPTSMVGLLLVS